MCLQFHPPSFTYTMYKLSSSKYLEDVALFQFLDRILFHLLVETTLTVFLGQSSLLEFNLSSTVFCRTI